MDGRSHAGLVWGADNRRNACFGVGVEFTSDIVVDRISGSPKTGHLTRDRLSTRDG